jgi:hypothetical protein
MEVHIKTCRKLIYRTGGFPEINCSKTAVEIYRKPSKTIYSDTKGKWP